MTNNIQQNTRPQATGMQRREEDPVQRIGNQLESLKASLRAALPRHMTPERVSRVFLTTLRQSPALMKCDAVSLLSAVFQASQLGLEIGNGLGHAYLVPYGREATLIIGYRGLVDLARRSGQVSNIYASEVRKGDKFKYQLGTDPKIEHEPGDNRGQEDTDITHVYAVCKMKDGSTQFEVMNNADVEKIRKRSRASKDGPWVSDRAMMMRKTVLRRLCKMLPTSVEMQTAISLDEAADANISQTFDVDLPRLSVESHENNTPETPHDENGEVIYEPGASDAP